MKSAHITKAIRIAAFALMGVYFVSAPALADCTSPASPEGGLAYFTTDDTYRLCNGSDEWVTLLSAGGEVTAPGDDKEIIFNSSGVLDAASTFVFDSKAVRFGVGEASPTATAHIFRNQSTTTLNLADTYNRAALTVRPSTGNQVLTVSRSAGGRLVIQGSSGTSTALDVAVNPYGGDFIVGSDVIADTGDGTGDTRMFFDVSTGAFRAGTVDGTQWDSLGSNTAAFGEGTSSTGTGTLAIGQNTTASNTGSLAIGIDTQATQAGAIAAGYNLELSGTATLLASGSGSIATGLNYTTGGATSSGITATQIGAFARGFSVANGGGQTASIGATGFASTAWGYATNEHITASGFASTAWGQSAVASGNYSTAVGSQVESGATNSVAFGLQTSTHATDPVVSGTRSFVLFMDGGTLNANDGYDFSATDAFGVIGGEIHIDDVSSSANKGCIRYNSATTKIQFSHDCSSYSDFGSGGGGGSPGGADTQIQFNNSGSFGANADFVFDTANTHVGIGYGSPNTHLAVHGAQSNTALLGASAGASSNALITLANNSDDISRWGLRLDSSGRLAFDYRSSVDGTPGTSLVLDRTGNVGIGVAQPDVELDVTGDIEYSGTITDVSDRRLKTDIKPLDARGSMLQRIDEINTYSFVMKDDEDKKVEFGVIAQEIEQVFPELVRTADDEMQTKSVNYVGLIAPLIEANKELRTENTDLAKRISDLESQKHAYADEFEALKRDVAGIKAHTGYGFGKAQVGLWLFIGLLGMGAAAFAFGRFSFFRARKN